MYSIINTITSSLIFSHSPPSPFIPPAVGPLAHSPSPASVPTGTSFPPSPVASLTAIMPEHYCSASPIEVRRGEWNALTSRADSPVVDPRLPRPPISATQRWPLPPFPVGGRSDNEPSPSSPILSPVTPSRRGVSIAELVDEEDSSTGTRGGMSPSRSAATCVNMSSAHYYPPLSISIVDVTPHSARRDPSESPCLSRIESLRSPSPPQSPPVSPADSDYHPSPSALRRSKQKRASDPATPEVPEGRVTRGSIKRKAASTENSESGTGSPKRVKTGSP